MQPTLDDLAGFLARVAAIPRRPADPDAAVIDLDPADYKIARRGPCNLVLSHPAPVGRALVRERGTGRWMALDLELGWIVGLPLLATQPDVSHRHDFARLAWPPVAANHPHPGREIGAAVAALEPPVGDLAP